MYVDIYIIYCTFTQSFRIKSPRLQLALRGAQALATRLMKGWSVDNDKNRSEYDHIHVHIYSSNV